jgi:hypothetical protein
MKFSARTAPVARLLVHPNNYRFLDLPAWKRRQERRFHDSTVQEATIQLLERHPTYQLSELRSSILANGYVPLERVVVLPYKHAKGYYIVVEGNRRVAALKTLLRDHGDGSLTLTDEQVAEFSKIPVAVLDPEEQSVMAAERVLMGIRHIAGPREWGAYQQAHFILELVDDEGQEFGAIANHLGLSKPETARRYRAMRALKAMENDEQYSAAAKPDLYRLFHELVAQPRVREFFGWDHERAAFRSEEQARQFFELVAPQDPDVDPKLRTYADVRSLSLKQVIGNPVAEAALLDPDQTLAAAIAKAKPEEAPAGAVDVSAEICRFIRVLQDITIEALRALSEEDVSALQSVTELVTARLEDYQALSH